MTDARLIFLEGDVAGVVQSILDMPVTSDCGGGVGCRHRVTGCVVCYLGGAAPQTCFGVSMQDTSGDTNDGLDQGLPLGSGNGARGAEYVGGPGFVPAVPGGDGGVAAGGSAGSAGGLNILQQSWLIVFELNDQASLSLCGSLEGFF